MDRYLHSNYNYETLGRTRLKAERRMLPEETDCNITGKKNKKLPNNFPHGQRSLKL